jgi:hypothetical protein
MARDGQALAERRKGGETGIKQVRCITGKTVFENLARNMARS